MALPFWMGWLALGIAATLLGPASGQFQCGGSYSGGRDLYSPSLSACTADANQLDAGILTNTNFYCVGGGTLASSNCATDAPAARRRGRERGRGLLRIKCESGSISQELRSQHSAPQRGGQQRHLRPQYTSFHTRPIDHGSELLITDHLRPQWTPALPGVPEGDR